MKEKVMTNSLKWQARTFL